MSSIPRTLLRASSLAYAAVVLVTILNRPLSLFTAHPVAMVAFLLLGVEAILTFRKLVPGAPGPRRKEQIELHLCWAGAAAASAVLGFIGTQVLSWCSGPRSVRK
ncbi:hypothetical protein BDK51DRAFT_49290 [Blyttiomyces helicus]|uniref:Uncharacterized protein n=1 Tax=Blyttiomyces helicus TaxID=388810 RepID=A0A4P9W895_9FUNG|nr:hypothetical protein BDK51DRAFT_49290 [Blyttiomyces helicus]|eukprot:RKO88554.1 hypothetical protein BDK51DRAFT_49290 [Blyttiomyces helicus]